MRKAAPLSLALLVLLTGCASRQLEKSLDPDSKEFLSKVRYIITSQERKIFLRLPPSERAGFIEEFWKKRDSIPETEENEYKDEYFKRIEEANHLFSDAGGKGWLEDRGRIYILLGPPEHREVYPRGMSFYDVPREIWYYGFYPIYFIDRHWDGSYELDPQSARDIALIQEASMDLKPKITREEIVFDFALGIKKTGNQEALIHVDVPYKNIWFSAEGDLLKTTITLSLEILDSSQNKVWDYSRDYLLSLAEEDAPEFMKKSFSAEIPVTLEPGKYSLQATFINKTGNSKARKIIDFEVEESRQKLRMS